MVKARANWQENQNNVDISNTYWFDESGANCGMTRLYGRAFSNERVNDYVPDVRFERTSVMGALALSGIIAPLTYKGTLNSNLFSSYVRECLAPVMKKGDTFMLDNCSVHTVKDILKPLIDKGVDVVFLPVYSPDFNPIELAWSKIKAYLRKVKAREPTELSEAIADALNTITKSDILGWVKHCGYGL